MSKDMMIITTICYILAFFYFYKYFKINQKIKKMVLTDAVCTDYIVKTTYYKKTYTFIYRCIYKKESFNVKDKTSLPFFKNKIKINNTYKMYINPHNTFDCITPYINLTYKFYLIIALALIIIPLIISI